MNPASWDDAQWALLALQVDPARLGGVWLKAGHGPVRDAWLAQLQTLLSDVREGERLIGVYHPTQGLQMWHEGTELRALGATPDTLLARVFMGIWLDPSTSAPELRQHLLGLNRP